MTASLQALPIELIEGIVTFLHLPDICCLRLACRETASKASQGVFRSFFKSKNVDLTITALQDTLDVMTQNGPACLLQACTITGIALEGSASNEQKDAECVSLLGKAFSRLKEHSPAGGLSSLSLRISARIEGANGELFEADEFRSWVAVLGVAQRTFTITIAALQESKIPITDNFDVFGSLKGCSLSADTFTFLNSLLAYNNFSCLRRLAVRLSAPFEIEEDHEIASPVQRISADLDWQSSNSILQRLINLIAGLPLLKDLDVHWYDLGRSNAKLSLEAASPEYFAPDCSFNSTALQSCALRGFKVSEEELLSFLTAIHPSSVTLSYIRLTSGTYTSVFAYLTDPEGPVTHYCLDDLTEEYQLVYYDAPGGAKFPYGYGVVTGPSTLERSDKCAKEAIRYHFPTTRALGSAKRMRWGGAKSREYGPGLDGYDFVKLNNPRVIWSLGWPPRPLALASDSS